MNFKVLERDNFVEMVYWVGYGPDD
jgi:hypothetical protein